MLSWDTQRDNRFTGHKYQSSALSITASCSCDMAGRQERKETHIGIYLAKGQKALVDTPNQLVATPTKVEESWLPLSQMKGCVLGL